MQGRYEILAAVTAGRLRLTVAHGGGQEVSDLLHDELVSRMVIDVATGIVMSQQGCSGRTRADSLRIRSQVSQVPLPEVASAVIGRVHGRCRPPRPPPFDL